MFKKVIHTIMILSFTTGCASMFNGTAQTFNLQSDTPKTKFYMNGQEIGTGSAVVRVAKKDMSHTVFTAKKEGCADSSMGIETRFDATTLLGVLIDFGIITILVVDLGINGATNQAVRTNYVLNPKCGS